jgi:predicted DNA-binding protein
MRTYKTFLIDNEKRERLKDLSRRTGVNEACWLRAGLDAVLRDPGRALLRHKAVRRGQEERGRG